MAPTDACTAATDRENDDINPARHLAWPTDLFTVTTSPEALVAVYAMHEAAHAVVAADLGHTVALIDIRGDRTEGGWQQATVLDGAGAEGEVLAVILAAARPAVTCYMHLLGREPELREELEESYRGDDATLRSVCVNTEVEAWVRNTAERWVSAQWGRITTLATDLIAARGRLEHPTIPPLARARGDHAQRPGA